MIVAVLPVCWALQPFRNADVAFVTAVRMNTTVTPCRWVATLQIAGTNELSGCDVLCFVAHCLFSDEH